MIKIKKHPIRYLLVSGCALLVVLVFFFWPLPKLVEGPGEAVDLKTMIDVKNHPDHQKGKLMLTSVGISQATPYTYVQKYFNPILSIENIDDVTGGQDDKTYDQVQSFYMQSAINSAIYVGYHAAHQPVSIKENGIYILSKLKHSAFPQLAVGDVILKIDGKKYHSAADYQAAIKSKKVGQLITIQYLRKNRVHTASGKLIQLPNTKQAGIGITLTDNLKVKTKLPVKIDPGQIGGPSAGMMFALQIYSQLANHDLKRGRIIAGTGTIAPNGQVGEIGGIDKKVITAKEQGATIFLAPYVKPTKEVLTLEPGHQTNYQLAKATAKKYAPNMKVIPVSTFQEALNALK